MARSTLLIVLVALGVLTLPLAIAAQEPPWARDAVIPLGGWVVIVLAAALAVFIVVVSVLLHLAPVVLALIGAVLGVRWIVKGGPRPESDRALEILRERYARGELSKEEFELRRRDLTDR